MAYRDGEPITIPEALILLGITLFTFIYSWFFLGPRMMPWWSDPGEWLKYSNAVEAELARILGYDPGIYRDVLETMWGQGVWQYPPLLFLILIPLKKFIGPLLSLKLLASILLSLQAIPIYLIARWMTGMRLGGLLAAIASTLLPINVEMWVGVATRTSSDTSS